MNDYPKWPHLENHYRFPDFLAQAGFITVTEKIHGFNARFGRAEDGTFWVGGRNQTTWEGRDEDFPEELPVREAMQGFTKFAMGRAQYVPAGWSLYGEWCGPGIQKGIDYGEMRRFFLFGASRGSGFMEWMGLCFAALRVCVDMVPLLHAGEAPHPSMEALVALAGSQSAVSEDEREGVVVISDPPVLDEYGHQVILKVKNPRFAERARERKPKSPPPDLSTVQGFVDDYATTERLHHVLDLVREEVGDTPWAPEYTGNVLRTYYQDVLREGADDHDKLSEEDQKLVGKVLNRPVKAMLDEYRGSIDRE